MVGAQTTVHIVLTTTVAKSITSGSSTISSTSTTTTPQLNPFTIQGPVAPALSTLRNLVPSSVQTDPTGACFVQQAYSACYTTPTWWSTIPPDSQTYFSSANAANNAACTSCSKPGLTTGAKAGIGVGVGVGVAALAGLAIFGIKAGLMGGILGGSAAKAASGGAASGSAAHAAAPAGQAGQVQMSQAAMASQGTGWSGATGGGQAGWSGATGGYPVPPPAHFPAGEVAGAAGGGLAGGIAAGALLGRRRESQQSGQQHLLAGSPSHESGPLTASSPALSSQRDSYNQPYYPPPQGDGYNYSQQYQQPPQGQYPQYPQNPQYTQQYQQQQGWQNNHSTPTVPEMGEPIAGAQFSPSISPPGQGHVEAGSDPIYEAGGTERRRY